MFSNRSKKGPPARPQARTGQGGLSFIGSDVLISGDITTNAQIHVDGRIEGNVRCERLIQGEGGTIAGHIVADQARIAGLIDGTIRARIVELEPSAKVTGDVTYESLNIAAGAVIEGRLARREGSAVDDKVATLLSSAGEAAKLVKPKSLPAPEKTVQALGV